MRPDTPLLPFLAALLGAAVAAHLLAPRVRVRRSLLAALLVLVTSVLTAFYVHQMIHIGGFGFDIGHMHNALWNMLEGRGLWADAHDEPLLAVHGTLTMSLYAPVVLLFESPSVLNVYSILCVLGSALAAAALARQVLGEREAALWAVLSFLLAAGYSGMVLIEHQHHMFAVPFFLTYLWAREAGRFRLAVLAAAAAALTFETFLLAVAIEGCRDLLARSGDRRFGWRLLAIALGAGALYAANRYGWEHPSSSRHYSAIGGSPQAFPFFAWQHPRDAVALLFTGAKVGYVIHLLLPVLGVCLLAPRALWFALPELALILLSNPHDDMHRIDCFYHGLSLIAVYYGGLLGWRRLCGDDATRLLRAMIFLALFGIGLQFCYNHTYLPRSLSILRAALTDPPNIREALIPERLVPLGARVLTHNTNDLVLLPRRRVWLDHDFLAPRVHRRLRAGELVPEFVVVKEGRSIPDAFPWLSDTAAVMIGRASGRDIYRFGSGGNSPGLTRPR